MNGRSEATSRAMSRAYKRRVRVCPVCGRKTVQPKGARGHVCRWSHLHTYWQVTWTWSDGARSIGPSFENESLAREFALKVGGDSRCTVQIFKYENGHGKEVRQ